MPSAQFNEQTMPTVSEKLIEPIAQFVAAQAQEIPKHHNEKLAYTQFFYTLLHYFISDTPSLKLFIARINNGALPLELGLAPVPYTTFQEGFSRFPPRLFQAAFQYLIRHLALKSVPEFAALGILCCVDGSLFPVISSMLWAEYTSGHQALKLHLCFELNRMVPVDFHVGSGNSSERQALLSMAQTGVTYIADRGYMSFKVCFELVTKQAFFIFRVKENSVYERLENLTVQLPALAVGLFQSVSDELIRCTNDRHQQTYRLVCFTINHETYRILTNRLDLNTFQVVMLYAYRWQIELMFRFLKRTMKGIHLVRHDASGVTVQFYMMLIVALLQIYFKQQLMIDYGTQHSESKNVTVQSKNPRSRLDQAGFLKSLGQSVKRYWKIGIHWLTMLRDLLAKPFDRRAIDTLLTTT